MNPRPLFSVPRGFLLAVLLAAVVGLAGLAAGCVSTDSSRSPRPTIQNPRWRPAAFARHMRFLREALEEQEATAGAADDAGDAPVEAYVSAAMKAAWLQPAMKGRYYLAARVPGRPPSDVGYVGYVGGKRPAVAEEAVLVCADLGTASLAEAAALLEVAGVYGTVAQYTLLPERSVIFALWPPARDAGGAPEPLAGLRAYLRRPTWRLDRVQSVLYVGLPLRYRAEARALLDAHTPDGASQIALQRIAVPEEPGGTDAGGRRENAETERALRLAGVTHRRLRAAVLTSGRMMPALGDTIAVPVPESR